MSNNLKKLREEKGYSRSDFARQIGMKSRAFLQQIEIGAKKLPKKYLDKVCFLLSATEEEIFGEEYKKEIDNELLGFSINVIDSITDASELTKRQRLDLIGKVYEMMLELSVKNLTPEEVDLEVRILKEKTEEAVKEIKRVRNNIFENLKQKLFKN